MRERRQEGQRKHGKWRDKGEKGEEKRVVRKKGVYWSKQDGTDQEKL